MAVKVSLRQKAISKNRQSLYLDFYPAIPHHETGEPTRREFLGLYVSNPVKFKKRKDKNGNEKQIPIYDTNIKRNIIIETDVKNILQRAEKIRQKREDQINKPEIYTGYEKEQLRLKQQGEQNFVTYFKDLADKRKESNLKNWLSAFKYLAAYTEGNLKFADLNEKFCNEFKEYLLTTKSNKSSKTTLAQNSAVSYFNKVKAALKQAYKDGFLTYDLNAKIEPIRQAETRRNFLTIEELNTAL